MEQSINKHFATMQKVPYFIFTKLNCKYCKYAKELLDDQCLEYETANCDIFLQTDEDKKIFLDLMEKKIGHRYKTFPMIFYKNEFVGGYTDLYNQFA